MCCFPLKKDRINLIAVLFLNAFIGAITIAGALTNEPEKTTYSGLIDRSAEKEVAKPDPISEKQKEIDVLAGSIQSLYRINRVRAGKFAKWVVEASEISSVPRGFIVALVATESSFRYEVESHAGAIGPAQVIPKFWSEWCEGSLNNPRDNIVCGARILSHYREQCDSWDCAFKKYNVGPSNYRRAEYVPAMSRYITKLSENIQIVMGSEGNLY